jgi:ribosomal protein S6
VYSYGIQAEPEDLEEIKKNVLYNKAIKRYFIFKMDPSDEFVTFAKVNDELKAIIETRDAKKL